MTLLPAAAQATDDGETADLVLLTLQLVSQSLPNPIPPELMQQIERQVKSQYGGRRHYLPKGIKHHSPEKRRALFLAALDPAVSERQLTEQHQISRATLYRLMKTGGGRFS